MLTALDDTLMRQCAEVLAHTPVSDHRFFDRTVFGVHAGSYDIEWSAVLPPHLEDRHFLRHGGRVVRPSALQPVRQGLGLDRDAMAAALKQYPPQDVFFDAGGAARENLDLQELLTQVINHHPATKGDKAEFRGKLHRYLEATGKRELQLAEKALARVPV